MGDVIPYPKPVTVALECKRGDGFVFITASRQSYGWYATTNDYDGPSSPLGYGKTSDEAIDELITQLVERGDV